MFEVKQHPKDYVHPKNKRSMSEHYYIVSSHGVDTNIVEKSKSEIDFLCAMLNSAGF